MRPFARSCWSTSRRKSTPQVARASSASCAIAPMGFASVEEAADAIAAYLPHRPRPKNLSGLHRNLRHRADGRWYWHWDPRFFDTFEPDHEAAARRYTAAARNVSVPTLLVRGSKSELVTPENVRHFLRRHSARRIRRCHGRRAYDRRRSQRRVQRGGLGLSAEARSGRLNRPWSGRQDRMNRLLNLGGSAPGSGRRSGSRSSSF